MGNGFDKAPFLFTKGVLAFELCAGLRTLVRVNLKPNKCGALPEDANDIYLDKSLLGSGMAHIHSVTLRTCRVNLLELRAANRH